ncbi:hypothetical protein PLESTF_000712600 [Pleodorina starrii]|nr:hypothetical protein PLESTF_000712600 [Pleodorina starrii]
MRTKRSVTDPYGLAGAAAAAAGTAEADAQRGQQRQLPPHHPGLSLSSFGLSDPFGLAGAAAAAGTAAADAQRGQQRQPPPQLQVRGPEPFGLSDPFGLAGASAAAAGTAAADAQRGQQRQPPPQLQVRGPEALGLSDPFGLAGAAAAAAGTAAADAQRGQQRQPPPQLPGLNLSSFGLSDPFGLAGASAAAAGTAAAGASWSAATSLRAGGGLGGDWGPGGAGNPSHQSLLQSPASRQRAASAAVAAEVAAACSQYTGTVPCFSPPVPTNVPAATKGGTKGGKKGPSLAVWPVIEGLHLLQGQKPWTKEPETLDDLFHLFYTGVKVGDRSIVPPWSTLYSLHGDKWYPANDTSLRKRMGELRHLHDTCIQDTAKLRSCTAREAAAFWTGKQREHAALTASGKLQALKVYWENVVNPLRKDSTSFAAYVAKQRPDTFTSPTKDILERKRGSKNSAAATAVETAAPPPSEGPSAAMELADTRGEQGTAALEGRPESLKKPPHSGHQMFVSHVMRTASVKLPEAVQRWKSLQPAEQEEWNQKCAAAKQAFKGAAAKKAL